MDYGRNKEESTRNHEKEVERIMFGVDLGLNTASVTLVAGRRDVDRLVIRHNPKADDKVFEMAVRIGNEIVKMAGKHGNRKFTRKVSIEEPIFSWGRKNPKGFAKSVALHTLIYYQLKAAKFKVISVNNKTAKRVAGHGSKDKEAMIRAYKKWTGALPGHSTKYGRETLADSYFIAQAGLRA